MDINRPIPAEVYEKFLGFPEDKDVASQFYQHCINIFDNLPSPQKIGTSEIKVLSIGTGYGRADFPLLKAYIKQYEELGLDRRLSFVVDCVDSSPDFQNMLGEALENDTAHYRIFKKNPDFFKDIKKKTFCATGKSASGNSKVVINGYCKTLTEFLSEMSKANDGSKPLFHCIIAILSLQYTKHLKITFPRLLEKLRHSGIIVIGETCAEGAWISKPPPLRYIPMAKTNNKRWFDLWTDWHKVLRNNGINRRLRLFMPHDFRLLIDTLERACFRSIIPNGKSEFIWQKTVTSEVFCEVVKLIQNGEWKNCVSSLYPFDQDFSKSGNIGTRIINILKSEEGWLNGEWKNNEANTTYENGLRFYIYEKINEKLTNYDGYKQILQKLILDSSNRTLRRQGIYEYIRTEETEEEKYQYALLVQLVQSLNQHIELDNGCFTIGLSVSSGKASKSVMGGSLIPCSNTSIRRGVASKFFENLLPPNSNEGVHSRVWIWIYTLYIALAKRPSAIADRIYKTFQLNSGFDCTVDMDAEIETFDFSRRGISVQLNNHRVKSIRKHVFSILKQNALNQIKDVAEWNPESEVVRALEYRWGEDSPLVKSLRNVLSLHSNSIRTSEQKNRKSEHSHSLPKTFYSAQPFIFTDAEIEVLCGKNTFNEIRCKMYELFKDWALDETVPGIYSILQKLYHEQLFSDNPIELWTEVFAQFYMFGLMLHETGINYILHIPGIEFNKANIWGGFQLFMDKEEYVFCKDMNNVPSLSDSFHIFMSPFDLIPLLSLVSQQIEDKARTGISHSLPYAVSIIMDRLLALEKSIEIFRKDHNTKIFDLLPPEIKKFKVSVELYQTAVQAALLSRGVSEEAFCKSIPHIGWIEKPILDPGKGITPELLRDLAEKIAFRLARFRLEYESEEIEMGPNPDPDDIVVNGPTIPKGKHGLNRKKEVAVFVTALISILKEAIQHRQIYLHWRKTSEQASQRNEEVQVDTAVHVNTHVDDQVWIEISNPCRPNDDLSNLRGGNQENELAFLSKNIPGWKINEPKKEKGRWIRRFVRNVRKEINE